MKTDLKNTPEFKLKLYKDIVELYEKDPNNYIFDFGLCYCIYCYMGKNYNIKINNIISSYYDTFSTSYNLKNYPEISLPIGNYKKYYFPAGNFEPRIELVKKAIIKLEKKLNK